MTSESSAQLRSNPAPSKVSRIQASHNLKADIQMAVNLIGGFEELIQPNDLVTIKPNMNTADPYPASSDATFIKALGELLLDAGASKLQIMDAATQRVCTRDVGEKIGLCDVAIDLDAEFISLDEYPWIKQEFPRARFLKRGHIGEPALNMGKLILAPCLKTHAFARFTASMKLLMGLLKREDRLKMHIRRLEPKIADLASYFNPSLIVMDARSVFVTKGPMKGKLATPNLILASHDMVAIDVVGVQILQSYNEKNKLNMSVWELPQIKHAADLKIGATCDEDITIVSHPGF
ncbi:MAG: DUF362 domain-containing protein [Candidatus Hodarchaeota archaeon]